MPHVPLISVGVPTYSRPEGLRRALRSLTEQTYENLEIIVSDNASPGTETSDVLSEFSADRRIVVHRQDRNIGAFANFTFVMNAAHGELFMWQADDDTRSPDCVETYANAIGNSGGAFGNYVLRDTTGAVDDVPVEVPVLSGVPGSRSDLTMFFRRLTPSMIYGLFSSDVIRRCWPSIAFDWFDVYTILRVIREAGMVTTSGPAHYFAGVERSYVVKPMDGVQLRPATYFRLTLPIAAYAGPAALASYVRASRGMLILSSQARKSPRAGERAITPSID